MHKTKIVRVLLMALVLVMSLSVLLTACSKPAAQPSNSPSESANGGESQEPGEAKLEPYELVILVAGDEPKDQQTVLDAVQEKLKDTLNVTLKVQYYPWADYQEKNKMMANAGDKFDIYLNFGHDILPAYTRKQAIKLNDLLDQYGPALKEKISEDNWAWGTANGDIIAIPAQYLKDGIYTTAILRGDLREKYNCPEVTSLDTAAQFLEAIAKNEPEMIPCFGGGFTYLAPHVIDEKYPEATQVGYTTPTTFSIGYWTDEGDDAFKVTNYYASKQAKEMIDIGVRGYNNGWFSKDLDKGLEGKPQFIGGKVALLNIDYYHFTDIEDNMKKSVPEAKLEWSIINPGQKLRVETCNNFAQISSSSKDPARAIMFLNWIQESQENYDLWYYGIEGTHYTLADDGSIVLPEGVDASNNPYAPTPWYFRNKDYDRNMSTDSALTKEAIEYFKTAELFPMITKSTGFAFDTTNVTLELGQIEKVLTEDWAAIQTGQKQGDGVYEQFLADLDKAGMPKVLEEMQTQLDEYIKDK